MVNYQYTPIRRAHVISPFGPGALQIMQNGVSAVTCGPPIWLMSLTKGEMIPEVEVEDSRLEVTLGVHRLLAPWPLSERPVPTTDWFIPAARFPLFEYCINYRCNKLHTRSPSDGSQGKCNYCADERAKKKLWPTTQVPIVLACNAGHLSDIPWVEWVHVGPDEHKISCAQPDLKYKPGGVPDQPRVECRTCNSARTFDRDLQFWCSGQRPWLPGLPSENCKLSARVAERSSATLYFPDVKSALAIPPQGIDNPLLARKIRTDLLLHSYFELFREDPSSSVVLRLMKERCDILGIETDLDQVKTHLDALNTDDLNDVGRGNEFVAMSEFRGRSVGSVPPDLVVTPMAMELYDSDAPFIPTLAGVSLVPRLREVRVLNGFSRNVSTESGAGGYEQLWGEPCPEDSPSDHRHGWLPAYEVYGEGILFSLRMDVVRSWLHSKAIAELLPRLSSRSRPEVVLVHSLAHAVMKAAAPYAGYPLPSLRERLYTEFLDEHLGFLIYTSQGDIRGTLGGLVELGRPGRLETLLREAASSLAWCSTDPVCIEDGVELGLSGTTSRGACHHCLMLPETSCEKGNHDLDRAFIIGHNLGSFGNV
jgi:hypothetical protein